MYSCRILPTAMAARFLTFLRVSRSFSIMLQRCKIDSIQRRCCTKVKTGVIMCGLFTGMSKDKSTEKRHILEEPDASKLSREYLIKSAGMATTEQACILLTQAALELGEARTQYAEALFALSVLMEYKLKVLGDTVEENRIWDLILEARDLVGFARKKKQTLEIIVNNAKNMVSAGAEVAYITGAELVGNTTGDHLNKVEMFLKQSEEECFQAELKLRDTEAKSIEVESKYAKEQKEKAEKAAAESKELEAEQKTDSDSVESEGQDKKEES